jgi:hypothetical protein
MRIRDMGCHNLYSMYFITRWAITSGSKPSPPASRSAPSLPPKTPCGTTTAQGLCHLEGPHQVATACPRRVKLTSPACATSSRRWGARRQLPAPRQATTVLRCSVPLASTALRSQPRCAARLLQGCAMQIQFFLEMATIPLIGKSCSHEAYCVLHFQNVLPCWS